MSENKKNGGSHYPHQRGLRPVVYRHLPEGRIGGLLGREGLRDFAPHTAMPFGKTSCTCWTKRFKETGHENVAMPLFIPESLLQRKKTSGGFAPEVAW